MAGRRILSTFRRPAVPMAPPPLRVLLRLAPSWGYQLTGAMFPDAYNPFALASVAGDRAWLDTKVGDMGPYFRRRGLVFADGKPLEPVELHRELASRNSCSHHRPRGRRSLPTVCPRALAAARSCRRSAASPDARFWVDDSRPGDPCPPAHGTPADHMIEVTTREQALLPAHSGLGYIRVKGITFQHAGNGLSTSAAGSGCSTAWRQSLDHRRQHHRMGQRQSVSILAAAGTPRRTAGRARRSFAATPSVTAASRASAVWEQQNTLIEDNLIEWCGWADAERGWEAAGSQIPPRQQHALPPQCHPPYPPCQRASGSTVGNANCRITSNVFADVLSVASAVHMEMNPEQNQIDNNIIWDVRNAEPGTPRSARMCGIGHFHQRQGQPHHRSESHRPLRQCRDFRHHSPRSQQ